MQKLHHQNSNYNRNQGTWDCLINIRPYNKDCKAHCTYQQSLPVNCRNIGNNCLGLLHCFDSNSPFRISKSKKVLDLSDCNCNCNTCCKSCRNCIWNILNQITQTQESHNYKDDTCQNSCQHQTIHAFLCYDSCYDCCKSSSRSCDLYAASTKK